MRQSHPLVVFHGTRLQCSVATEPILYSLTHAQGRALSIADMDERRWNKWALPGCSQASARADVGV